MKTARSGVRAIVKRCDGKRLPRISRGHRFAHRRGRKHDGVAFYFRFRPMPLVVFSGDGKFSKLAALHNESAIGVVKMNFQRAGQRIQGDLNVGP